MPLVLHVISGPGTGQAIPVEERKPLILGRGKEASVRIPDPALAKRHCAIEWSDSGFRLVDLGSPAGTHVNGERIGSAILNPGDRIAIGSLEIEVGSADVYADLKTIPQGRSVAAPRIGGESGGSSAPGAPAARVPPAPPLAGPLPGRSLTDVPTRGRVERATRDGERDRGRDRASGRPGTAPPAAAGAGPGPGPGIVPASGRLPATGKLPPEGLAGFQVLETIASGGVATVYHAYDKTRKRPVALKVVKLTGAADDEVRRRFQREVEVAAMLAHPAIVPVIDAQIAGRLAWLVLPYVEGEDLGRRVARVGALPVSDVLAITRIVLEALAYAHERGVVHRDVKPANVLLPRAGGALLADFGLAKCYDALGATILTQAGVGLGTPAYMAPEQCEDAARADARSDVYGVGATLYTALSGQPPYPIRSFEAFIRAMAKGPPRPLREVAPSVPAPLAALVARALERDASARYPSAAVMLDATERVIAELR